MPVMEVLAGRVLNPGAAVTALTPNTGDSFTVRAFPDGAKAYLEDMWTKGGTAGIFRLTSNRLHDPVQGIRVRNVANAVRSLIPDEVEQALYSADTLLPALSGGGAETDVGCLLMYYQQVDGLDAKLYSYADIAGQIVNYAGFEVATTASATAGDWSGGTAINATFDLFKADTNYAVLGYLCDTNIAAVAIRGADTGNVRIGGPGSNEALVTYRWFIELGDQLGKPCIPVIKAGNRASTQLFVVDSAANTAVNVTLLVAQLA